MIITLTLLIGSMAQANLSLANNGKKIVCYADDSQVWQINVSRTKMKYTIEGESLGAFKVLATLTDGNTFIDYTTEEGTLTLNQGNSTFKFTDSEDIYEIDCK